MHRGQVRVHKEKIQDLTAPLDGALYAFFCAEHVKDVLSGRVLRLWRNPGWPPTKPICTFWGVNATPFILVIVSDGQGFLDTTLGRISSDC